VLDGCPLRGRDARDGDVAVRGDRRLIARRLSSVSSATIGGATTGATTGATNDATVCATVRADVMGGRQAQEGRDVGGRAQGVEGRCASRASSVSCAPAIRTQQSGGHATMQVTEGWAWRRVERTRRSSMKSRNLNFTA